MNIRIAEKKAKLSAEITEIERRLHELALETRKWETRRNEATGALNLILEIEAEEATLRPKRETDELLQRPVVSLSASVRKAAVALKRFTRDDIEQWIRSNYPHLDFSPRSIEGPLRRLIEDHLVQMVRPNTGNKVPAIYGTREGAETEILRQDADEEAQAEPA